MSSYRKEIERLAASMGWRIMMTRGNHIKLVKHGFRPIYASCSPGDRRALYHVRADLRRAERENRHVR